MFVFQANPDRPYFYSSIDELESVFNSYWWDDEKLEELLFELDHRKTFRAKRLRERVVATYRR